MLQLSKKVEYGLIALRHIASNTSDYFVTTKEIADYYKLSYDLLAKVMQRLAKKGVLISHQGVRGGYTLAKNPSEVTVSDVIQAIEDKQSVYLVQCGADNPDTCVIHDICTIRYPLVKLQGSIKMLLDRVTIREMV